MMPSGIAISADSRNAVHTRKMEMPISPMKPYWTNS